MARATRGRGRGRPKGSVTKCRPVEQTEFACTVCGVVFGREDELVNHKVQMHSEIYEFECGQCDHVFQSLCEIQGHFYQVHGGQSLVNGGWDGVRSGASIVERPAACDTRYPDGCFQTPDPVPSIPTLRPVGVDESYECGQCDRQFLTLGELENHFYQLHVVSGGQRTSFSISEQITGSSFGNITNESVVNPASIRTRSATAAATAKPQFTEIQSEETSVDIQPASPDYDDERYDDDPDYDNDEDFEPSVSDPVQDKRPLVEASVCRYQCGQCHKSYTQKSDLTIHLRTHAGVRPYKCEICGKDFNVHRTLVNHVRRHNKAYRFFCEVIGCGKGFTTTQERNRHEIRHVPIHLRPPDKTYQCQVCKKFFTQKIHLTKHMMFIHERKEGKHVCELCGKKFRTASCLKTHMLSIKHGGTGVSYKNKKKPRKLNPKKPGRKKKNHVEQNSMAPSEYSGSVESVPETNFKPQPIQPSTFQGQLPQYVSGYVGQQVLMGMPIGTITLQDAFQIGYGVGN